MCRSLFFWGGRGFCVEEILWFPGKGLVVQYEQETLRKLQLVELGILKDIDSVCRENSITYFLDFGTVLGAARHGGFIPWDDDIDIGMPRESYERFLEIAPEALGPKYVVSTPRTNANQAVLFTKVMLKGTCFTTEEAEDADFRQGIFVDVFPYYPLCADRRVEKKQRYLCFFWQSVSYLYHSRFITVPHGGVLGACERAACAVAHGVVRALFSPQAICKAFERAACLGERELAGRSMLNASYAMGEPRPRDVLIPPRPITFEGYEFFGPAKPEQCLEILYGAEWKELPPVESRRNHAPKQLVFNEMESR